MTGIALGIPALKAGNLDVDGIRLGADVGVTAGAGGRAGVAGSGDLSAGQGGVAIQAPDGTVRAADDLETGVVCREMGALPGNGGVAGCAGRAELQLEVVDR